MGQEIIHAQNRVRDKIAGNKKKKGMFRLNTLTNSHHSDDGEEQKEGELDCETHKL